MAGDGQVTIGQTVVKAGARKVRKVYGERLAALKAPATTNGAAHHAASNGA